MAIFLFGKKGGNNSVYISQSACWLSHRAQRQLHRLGDEMRDSANIINIIIHLLNSLLSPSTPRDTTLRLYPVPLPVNAAPINAGHLPAGKQRTELQQGNILIKHSEIPRQGHARESAGWPKRDGKDQTFMILGFHWQVSHKTKDSKWKIPWARFEHWSLISFFGHWQKIL